MPLPRFNRLEAHACEHYEAPVPDHLNIHKSHRFHNFGGASLKPQAGGATLSAKSEQEDNPPSSKSAIGHPQEPGGTAPPETADQEGVAGA